MFFKDSIARNKETQSVLQTKERLICKTAEYNYENDNKLKMFNTFQNPSALDALDDKTNLNEEAELLQEIGR